MFKNKNSKHCVASTSYSYSTFCFRRFSLFIKILSPILRPCPLCTGYCEDSIPLFTLFTEGTQIIKWKALTVTQDLQLCLIEIETNVIPIRNAIQNPERSRANSIHPALCFKC